MNEFACTSPNSHTTSHIYGFTLLMEVNFHSRGSESICQVLPGRLFRCAHVPALFLKREPPPVDIPLTLLRVPLFFLTTNFQDQSPESDHDVQQRTPASSSSNGKRKLASLDAINKGPAVRGLHCIDSRALRTIMHGLGSRIHSRPYVSWILTQRCNG